MFQQRSVSKFSSFQKSFTYNRYVRFQYEAPPALLKLQNSFIHQMKQAIDDFKDDIPPHTKYRKAGYARYRLSGNSITALKLKDEVNVLVGTTRRSYSCLPNHLREHPVLHDILLTLNNVWSQDLGPEMNVNVHPVRVSNYFNGSIHNEAKLTPEGTHKDSVERLAIVLLERHNVLDGTAKTAIYSDLCPLGKLRGKPGDEEEIGPLRLVDAELKHPFEVLTFDDTRFKHDASIPIPENAKQPMHRYVLLIMCRKPCLLT
eukprot:TRINITY_DN10325_c0_g1_i3.p1 TRINITY_DN10325_c0_g1~~TRINITY_DN10325_c0_g1_i3.p1  ORF type:complete len:276 (-),score=53.73 TRINITY_DN10325_c0_g1_i3:143-922(-)